MLLKIQNQEVFLCYLLIPSLSSEYFIFIFFIIVHPFIYSINPSMNVYCMPTQPAIMLFTKKGIWTENCLINFFKCAWLWEITNTLQINLRIYMFVLNLSFLCTYFILLLITPLDQIAPCFISPVLSSFRKTNNKKKVWYLPPKY